MRFIFFSLLWALPVTAGQVNWVDWTSSSGTGANQTATGILHLGSTDVTVTYAGEIDFAQTSGGTDFWTGSPSPYTSAAVDNAPDWDGSRDIIALYQTQLRTLTFSQPVDNLFFAVVSLNGNGYVFDRDFNILSYGCGYWGCGTLTKSTPGPGQFELNGATGEPHGTIQFVGAFSTISWTSAAAETWNGFTIGTYGLASETGLAPEPSSWCLALIGVAGLRFVRRRR
jgi:MYXO-CTERM domain-containing protein